MPPTNRIPTSSIDFQAVLSAFDAGNRRLAALVRRLPGWEEGASTPAVLIDFLASEYGWTLDHIAGVDARQMIAFAERALRRKQFESSRMKEPAAAGNLDERATAFFVGRKGQVTKKEIAVQLGCNEKSLSPKRRPQLARAMSAYRAGNAPPRGSKSKDANMEAWDD